MNFLEAIKAYAGSPSAKGFKRPSFAEGSYCYLSDIDFCVYRVLNLSDDDEVFAYGPDLQATDWELV